METKKSKEILTLSKEEKIELVQALCENIEKDEIPKFGSKRNKHY